MANTEPVNPGTPNPTPNPPTPAPTPEPSKPGDGENKAGK